MSIDLDALEQLAADASPGPWIDALPDIDAQSEKDASFIIACDPATVAALTRAIRAALTLDAVHALDAGQAERDLADALAPFRDNQWPC